MATVDQKTKILPAYVAYGTFKNFIESLKETGLVLQRIDKTVMPNLAGGTQGHLLSSLKFLDLIGHNGEPRPQLVKLVEASGTDKWPKALAAVVESAYAEIIGGMALKSATPAMLMECFRKDKSLDGATLDKAMRFYLQAMKEAGIEHSSYLDSMKVKTSYKRAPKASPAAASNGDSAAAAAVNTHDKSEHKHEPGMMTFPIYFKGKPTGKIIVPETISPDDCAMVGIALKMIEAYAGQNPE